MKNLLFALVIGLTLGLTQIVYAGYVAGFKVIEVGDSQMVIQKDDAEPITLKLKNKKFKIGDKVKYDAKKLKVRKDRKSQPLEGC
ncbi:MAG: hypothetical protein OEM02_10530 [Desulfobulbaceae bacterium]|nr:hypothetical protein [Desulfobulbaceae bacterium]